MGTSPVERRSFASESRTQGSESALYREVILHNNATWVARVAWCRREPTMDRIFPLAFVVGAVVMQSRAV